MSKLETNTIDTLSGTTNLTIGSTNTSSIALGASGDTVTVPNGSLTGQNYPMFYVIRNSVQSLPNNTLTKIQFNQKYFDTDSGFDITTNYRYTIPTGKGGKYYFQTRATAFSTSNDVEQFDIGIYKNGSVFARSYDMIYLDARHKFTTIYTVDDAAEGDYYEANVFLGLGTSVSIYPDATTPRSISFLGYRIGA